MVSEVQERNYNYYKSLIGDLVFNTSGMTPEDLEGEIQEAWEDEEIADSEYDTLMAMLQEYLD